MCNKCCNKSKELLNNKIKKYILNKDKSFIDKVIAVCNDYVDDFITEFKVEDKKNTCDCKKDSTDNKTEKKESCKCNKCTEDSFDEIERKNFEVLNKAFNDLEGYGKFIYNEHGNVIGHYCCINFGTLKDPELRFGWSIVHEKDRTKVNKKYGMYISLLRLFNQCDATKEVESIYENDKRIDAILQAECPNWVKDFIFEDIISRTLTDVINNVNEGMNKIR